MNKESVTKEYNENFNIRVQNKQREREIGRGGERERDKTGRINLVQNFSLKTSSDT